MSCVLELLFISAPGTPSSVGSGLEHTALQTENTGSTPSTTDNAVELAIVEGGTTVNDNLVPAATKLEHFEHENDSTSLAHTEETSFESEIGEKVMEPELVPDVIIIDTIPEELEMNDDKNVSDPDIHYRTLRLSDSQTEDDRYYPQQTAPDENYFSQAQPNTGMQISQEIEGNLHAAPLKICSAWFAKLFDDGFFKFQLSLY